MHLLTQIDNRLIPSYYTAISYSVSISLFSVGFQLTKDFQFFAYI